ncbi:MAG: hypothetical protein Q8P61_06530 [Candidatus Nanopelagicales bacterium]|nr:hypothetical protein [Candidatus Nanopelagicales bacterium]
MGATGMGRSTARWMSTGLKPARDRMRIDGINPAELTRQINAIQM